MADEITYDELRRVQQREKGSGMLSELPEDFYERAGRLVRRLRKEMESGFAIEKAKEYENTLKVVREIYALREQKLIFRALSSAREGEQIFGLAREEGELYRRVAELVREGQKSFERVISGTEAPRSGAENAGAEVQKAPRSDEKNLRMLMDVPQFVGMDGKVRGPFRKGESVLLPTREAELLLKKKMAETMWTL